MTQLALFTALGTKEEGSLRALKRSYNELCCNGFVPTVYIGAHKGQVELLDRQEHIANYKTLLSEDFASWNGYNKYSLESFHNISEDFVLTVQYDGFVLNGKLLVDNWNEFTACDYIGAPWFNTPYPVGNSGFCWRSRKLNQILGLMVHKPTHNINFEPINYMIDDVKISLEYRPMLEKCFGIRYASLETATKFSFETKYVPNTFGFHGFFTEEARQYINGL